MSACVATLRGRYLAAQLAGNRREAARLVVDEGLGAGLPVTTLRSEVIRGAQDEIGRLWQENRISIAQEHMATAVSHFVMALLLERAAPAPSLGRTVLVACVEGELHDMPARIVADDLDGAGFDVRYLGANVPTDHLLALVRDERPDLVALSVTMSFHLPALRAAVTRLRALGDTPILVGGHAVAWSPGVIEALGVLGCGAEPGSLVAAARRAVGLP